MRSFLAFYRAVCVRDRERRVVSFVGVFLKLAAMWNVIISEVLMNDARGAG